jgi:hypothetical protein
MVHGGGVFVTGGHKARPYINRCFILKGRASLGLTTWQKGAFMWGLEELKGHREILDRIDWEMTPEKAVETYLEWGTGWSRKGEFVHSVSQESLYFVIYAWEEPPQVTLIRRDARDADELAKVPAPAELIQQAIDEAGRKPGVGVYALTDEVRDWLKEVLGC